MTVSRRGLSRDAVSLTPQLRRPPESATMAVKFKDDYHILEVPRTARGYTCLSVPRLLNTYFVSRLRKGVP